MYVFHSLYIAFFNIFFSTDPSEFYCQNEVKTVPVDLGKETVTNSQFLLYIAGIIIAFVVVVIGILVHQLYSSKQQL